MLAALPAPVIYGLFGNLLQVPQSDHKLNNDAKKKNTAVTAAATAACCSRRDSY
jgi:hypothetical protein